MVGKSNPHLVSAQGTASGKGLVLASQQDSAELILDGADSQSADDERPFGCRLLASSAHTGHSGRVVDVPVWCWLPVANSQ